MKTRHWFESFVGIGLLLMACGPRPDDDGGGVSGRGGTGGTSQGGSSGTAGQGSSGCGPDYTLKDGGSTRPPTGPQAAPSLMPLGAAGADAGSSDPNRVELCLTLAELAALRDTDAGPQPGDGDGTTCPYVNRQAYPEFPAPWVRWMVGTMRTEENRCCYTVGPSCS